MIIQLLINGNLIIIRETPDQSLIHYRMRKMKKYRENVSACSIRNALNFMSFALLFQPLKPPTSILAPSFMPKAKKIQNPIWNPMMNPSMLHLMILKAKLFIDTENMEGRFQLKINIFQLQVNFKVILVSGFYSVTSDQVTRHLSLIAGNYALRYLARISKIHISKTSYSSKRTKIGLR